MDNFNFQDYRDKIKRIEDEYQQAANALRAEKDPLIVSCREKIKALQAEAETIETAINEPVATTKEALAKRERMVDLRKRHELIPIEILEVQLELAKLLRSARLPVSSFIFEAHSVRMAELEAWLQFEDAQRRFQSKALGFAGSLEAQQRMPFEPEADVEKIQKELNRSISALAVPV